MTFLVADRAQLVDEVAKAAFTLLQNQSECPLERFDQEVAVSLDAVRYDLRYTRRLFGSP